MNMFLIVGIKLIFLAASVASLNATSKLSSEKYIAGSYFDKYDCLVDSEFQDFIENDLPLGMCEVLEDKLNLEPRLLSLHRQLIGQGSHRRLYSSIRFKIQPGSVYQPPAHSCEIAIVERLPSGIFADPFELQHLLQRSAFSDAAVLGDTNLELPSFRSNRSIVEVHMDVGSNILSNRKDDLQIKIEVPLHARYPPLEEQGFSRVEFGQPDLFMTCSFEGKPQEHSCLFRLLDDTAKSNADAVVWEVPCGIKNHLRAVSTITFISAGLSVLLILLTDSHSRSANNLKQS